MSAREHGVSACVSACVRRGPSLPLSQRSTHLLFQWLGFACLFSWHDADWDVSLFESFLFFFLVQFVSHGP